MLLLALNHIDRWQLSFDIIWHYVVSHLAYVPLWYDSMIRCCVAFGIGGGGIEIKFPSVITCFDGLTKSRCEPDDFYGKILMG